MSSFNDLLQARATLAHVLSAAVVDLFPKVQKQDLCANYGGFYSDFIFTHEISQEDLARIEEKMKAILSEDFEAQHSEMLCQNLQEFFRHQGQHLRARQLKAYGKDLLPTIHFAHYRDFAPQDFIALFDQLPHFRLFKVEQCGFEQKSKQYFFRIHGLCFESKEELKQVLKLRKKQDKLKPSSKKILDEKSSKNVSAKEEKLSKSCELPELYADSVFLHYRQKLIDFYMEEMQAMSAKQLMTSSFIPHERPLFSSLPSKSCLFASSDLDPLMLHGEEWSIMEDKTIFHLLHASRQGLASKNFQEQYHRFFEVFHQPFAQVPIEFDCMHRPAQQIVEQATYLISQDALASEINSFLQFMEKIAKIFSLDYFLCLSIKNSSQRKYTKEEQNFIEAVKKSASALSGKSQLHMQEAESFALEIFWKSPAFSHFKGPSLCLSSPLLSRKLLSETFLYKSEEVSVLSQSMFCSFDNFVLFLLQESLLTEKTIF